MTPQASNVYSFPQRLCHWAIAILFLVQIPLGFTTTFFMDTSGRDLPIFALAHFIIGFIIMLLGIFLFLDRCYRGAPPSLAIPRWQRKLAKMVQAFLLFSLAVIPMTGGAYLIGFTAMERLHRILAIIAIFLVTVHATAALFHHFIMRDTTLRRMLMGR